MATAKIITIMLTATALTAKLTMSFENPLAFPLLWTEARRINRPAIKIPIFMVSMVKYTYLFLLFLLCCNITNAQIITGANQPEAYLSKLKGKKIALVVNQTSKVEQSHIVDFLIQKQVVIKAIFAPEHGFRGDHSAGENVKSSLDAKTGLPIYSLYGSQKKPTKEMLQGVDLVVFDIQDVGARFYTYISTLHYVMEACAEQNKSLLILDRPNPNGFFIDGPILDTNFKSFVGMHPVPVVHGCTIAEYAQMINGEKWLKNKVQCKLEIVKVKNYAHWDKYQLPIKPSPNLPNMSSIYLYPSLCFFEGTNYSIGRGTKTPFECVGKPGIKIGSDTFTPKHLPGIADHPPHEGKLCKGFNLQFYGNNIAPYQGKLNLFWLMDLYRNDPDSSSYFNNFFDKLAGTDELRKQIIAGKSEEEIRQSWQKGLVRYRAIRNKYLLYSDRIDSN